MYQDAVNALEYRFLAKLIDMHCLCNSRFRFGLRAVWEETNSQNLKATKTCFLFHEASSRSQPVASFAERIHKGTSVHIGNWKKSSNLFTNKHSVIYPTRHILFGPINDSFGWTDAAIVINTYPILP